MGEYDFEVAVIGGGSAGYATARTTAGGGRRTVVIEGGGELGGLCILRGCMPTKALLHAADVRHQARRSGVWGLEPGEVGFDFPAVMRRKAAMVEEFASYRRGQLQDSRFKLIRRWKGPQCSRVAPERKTPLVMMPAPMPVPRKRLTMSLGLASSSSR